MDKSYREELKKHLKKSFQTNKLEKALQSPATDFVQTLIPSTSVVPSFTSRTIDALLDASYSSGSDQGIYDLPEFTEFTEFSNPLKYTPEDAPPKPAKPTKNSINPLNPIDKNRRVVAGGINEDTITPNPSCRTVCSNANSTFSKASTFKRRTSRDLRNMVKSQCKVVESLNMVGNDYDNGNHFLPPSMVLWKSKRKFSSSVDLHSDILKRSEPSIPNLSKKLQNITVSQKFPSVKCTGLSALNAESIVRDQFTAPLIREVERVYVQNITTTADLLKRLDCMPGDIDKALAKMHHKFS